MPDATYTMTVSGQSLNDLKNNLKSVVDTMEGHDGRVTPAGIGLSVETPVTEEASAEEAPLLPVKRRGRPPGSTSQTAASQAGNGAQPSAQTKSLPQLRQEATDILKACWGAQPDGAEKVIALQQKFNVKRFAEVGDDRIPTLYQSAVALQNELAGGGAAEAETGPF